MIVILVNCNCCYWYSNGIIGVIVFGIVGVVVYVYCFICLDFCVV